MNSRAFTDVLERYEARADAEARMWQSADPGHMFARRDEFLLHVGRETADFLMSLAVARKARRIVELGTSYGYSTLFLAEAARRTGGVVRSYELSAQKQAYARAEIERAGLSAYVDWQLGDAVALLDDEAEGIDFVLIDLWKDLYIPCLKKLYPKLAHNALVAADNMLEPSMSRPEAEAYRAAVRAKADLQTVLLPIGSGIELSCVWRGGAR